MGWHDRGLSMQHGWSDLTSAARDNQLGPTLVTLSRTEAVSYHSFMRWPFEPQNRNWNENC
jgi:hypothetical protein